MRKYQELKKELTEVIKNEVNDIAEKLISENRGKSVFELKKITLAYIRENSVPEEISSKLKNAIDEYVSGIKIPVQK